MINACSRDRDTRISSNRDDNADYHNHTMKLGKVLDFCIRHKDTDFSEFLNIQIGPAERKPSYSDSSNRPIPYILAFLNGEWFPLPNIYYTPSMPLDSVAHKHIGTLAEKLNIPRDSAYKFVGEYVPHIIKQYHAIGAYNILGDPEVGKKVRIQIEPGIYIIYCPDITTIDPMNAWRGILEGTSNMSKIIKIGSSFYYKY